MNLKNKVVLVSGSNTGIGAAIAELCVAQGATLMIHGRDADRAAKMAKHLGNGTEYYVGDLIAPDFCEEVVHKTVEKFGRIDAVINNAALTTRSTIETTDAHFFDRMIGINLRAPILISRTAVEYFRKQGKGGAIVNIGSINAYCGENVLLAYSVSKGGLMTFTRNLADTLGPEQIRVNQINVGWTATPNEIALKKSQGFADDWQSRIPREFAPRGYLLKPEEVARHAVFWISDDSAPVSGSVVEVETYPVIGRNRLGYLEIPKK